MITQQLAEDVREYLTWIEDITGHPAATLAEARTAVLMHISSLEVASLHWRIIIDALAAEGEGQ